jgi:hypothetical protein
MDVYAVYAHAPLSPVWRLQEVFDAEADAKRYADSLVLMPGVGDRADQARQGEGGGWEEAVVQRCASRADVHDPLPDDRVAAITWRAVRPGYAMDIYA